MGLSGSQLVAWQQKHERRARSPLAPFVPILVGGAVAAWVGWRAQGSFAAGSNAWLSFALLAFAIGFMRVPFHLYWRADAALLAQLPIDGKALLAPALWRCTRSALQVTAIVAIGAAPLAGDTALFARHLATAAVLGVTCALFLPAVALGAATIVALTPGNKVSSTPVLGALPGFAATGVIIAVILGNRWLTGRAPVVSPVILGAILVGVSVFAYALLRAGAPRHMGQILRDVSALDRQRLATLEIHPPTAIERRIAGLLGSAALPYQKDARLMRRRYPMAFALGGLAFAVLVIVALARPADPTPWLAAVLGGGLVYAVALFTRLRKPPIELRRLSASLPIAPSAIARAKHAWLVSWVAIFVAVPGAIALLANY